jgi:hypothetical protein
LCIYKDSERHQAHLAAFVDGFAWRHGDDEAVILFNPEMMPIDTQQFAAFKAAAEDRILTANISQSELVPGYICVANA